MSHQSDIQPAAWASTIFRYEARDLVAAQQSHVRLRRKHMIALTIFFIAAASAAFVLLEVRRAVAIQLVNIFLSALLRASSACACRED